MAADRKLGEVQRGLLGPGALERAHRRRHGFAVLLLAELALAPETDQQDATGGPGRIVEQQRRAEPALHVAAAHDLAQVALGRAVERRRRGGKPARLVDACHHATIGAGLRRTTFYAKFHRALPVELEP